MAAVSNKFRDLLQVSVLLELLLVSGTGWSLSSGRAQAGIISAQGLGHVRFQERWVGVQEGANPSALRHGSRSSPFAQPHQLAAAEKALEAAAEPGGTSLRLSSLSTEP